MNASFERTLRALDVERRGRAWPVLVAVALVAAWLVWAAVAEVGVNVWSTTARIEATGETRRVHAEVAGRVLESRIALGLEVRDGDVLLELDTRDAEARLVAAEDRARSLQAERDAIERALDAAAAAKAAGTDVLGAALAEAKASAQRASALARQSEREVARLTALAASPDGSGAISPRELDRVKADAAVARADVAAKTSVAARLEADEARDAHDRESAIELLRKDLGQAGVELADARREHAEATLAIERGHVRAAVNGKIADAPLVWPGQWVAAGQDVCTIVPAGPVRLVARFPVEDAAGRISRGAEARLRLDAFPWTWYGDVGATVENIGLEPQDGLLRVEFAIESDSKLPLAHGLTGQVAVKTEQATPLALLLRAAGARQKPEPAPAR